MSLIQEVTSDLKTLIKPEKAQFFPKFFKSFPGGYGEGDKFLGVIIPDIRKVVSKYVKRVSLLEVENMLRSEWHELRMLSLLMLVKLFEKGDAPTRKEIFDLYLRNTEYVNNWDLVDASATAIVGGFLYNYSGDTVLLDKLAASKNLWENRIAMIATFYFIRKNEFEPTLRMATKLLAHQHDLIHKAIGWMLREMGKRDLAALKKFLDQHASHMSRTTLRYAIEKLNNKERLHYLSLK